jgi:hypothetical protein
MEVLALMKTPRVDFLIAQIQRQDEKQENLTITEDSYGRFTESPAIERLR